jgi:hypothetical protein
MAGVRCPMCGKPNPAELEKCKFCDARLKPLLAPAPDDSQSIKGDKNPASGDIVQAGEAPTDKKTSELEPGLPSWLRTLRKSQDAAESKFTEDASADQHLTHEPGSTSHTDSSGDLPDWLSGLGEATSGDEEEIPDWLISLRSEETGSFAPASEPTSDFASKGLGSEPQSVTPETAPQGGLPGEGESLDWLESLKSESTAPGLPEQRMARQDQDNEWMPAWPSDLSGRSEEEKPASSQGENMPDWLNQLKEKASESDFTPLGDDGTTAGVDNPDWLSNFRSTPGTLQAAAEESRPEWLEHLDAKTGPEPGEPAPKINSEPPPSRAARDETPNWLSQFQADVNAAKEQEAKNEQFEAAPQPPAKESGSGSLPDWLAGIKQNPIPSDGTPALIASHEGTAPEEKSDAAFSMDVPDWLSKLKPEQSAENIPEGDVESPTPEDIEITELPSWIQAMRPVESVVGEAKAIQQENMQVTERNGPLVGMRGVLPAGPGLGALRKPPAYATTLQVTDGQQRYAAALEQLITTETEPQTTKRTRLASSRLLRWLIVGLLILAVGLPLSTKIQVTQASTLQMPEMLNAFTLISSLPSNAPVLVVFDYDPALSGELEAAAAPLMDQLLVQGPRLALVSTNPTGPALAERFLREISASPLVASQQYVNLGYLVGGPSGVLYFAISPEKAAPFTLDGQQAWQLPPLQGIQKLSDFSSIIVITDNADSGRVWIEQTGTTIGNTPILMIISAQVEPMILPYYDSGQIKGLVTGLAGGEAYGQTLLPTGVETGLAQRYWNSFSTGTLVAEILIVIGALWSLVSGWLARNNKSGEGA